MAEILTALVSSKPKTVDINREEPTAIIEERINPTGLKRVLEALKSGDFSAVREDTLVRVSSGATVLDGNAGVPGTDEPDLLKRVIREVLGVTDVPLCIATADPASLEAALWICQGKALPNSVAG